MSVDTEITRLTMRRYMGAYAAGDEDTIAALIAPDAVTELVGPREFLPWCGRHFGREANLANLALISTLLSVREYKIVQIIADQENAAARAIGTFVVRRTSRVCRVELFISARVVDGLIVEWREVFDSLSAARDLFGIDLAMLSLSFESLEPQRRG